MKLWPVAIIWLFVLSASPAAHGIGSDELWLKANEALTSGDYAVAEQLYDGLLATHEDSGALHYNLGVAQFRQKKIGRSIYHFRRARALLPRDADLHFNLGFARNQTTDKIENKTDPVTAFVDERLPVNQREVLAGLAIATTLAFFFAAALAFRRREGLVIAQRACLFAALVFLGLTGLRHFADRPFGVVTGATANVYSGFGKDTVLLFTLHDGAEFVVEERQEEWLRIQLADGKKGWLKGTDALF